MKVMITVDLEPIATSAGEDFVMQMLANAAAAEGPVQVKTSVLLVQGHIVDVERAG